VHLLASTLEHAREVAKGFVSLARDDRARQDAGVRRDHFLIVTGPGRSGTSAVARVLHESGLRMGDNLAAASEFNQAGFYEEVPVVELNDQILADCALDAPGAWATRETVLSAALPYRQQMAEIVAASTAEGWKDPRLCVTLEAWLPHLPARPDVIVCLRSPEAFVNSVISIFGLSPREDLEAWWENHLRRIVDIVDGYSLRATSVVYEELIDDPERTVAALSAFVGRELDAGLVQPELRQFAHEVPARHRALFDEVRSLAKT
jgi:hypothetical protein